MWDIMRSPEQVLKALNKHGKVSGLQVRKVVPYLIQWGDVSCCLPAYLRQTRQYDTLTDGKPSIGWVSKNKANHCIPKRWVSSLNPAKGYIPKKNGKKRPAWNSLLWGQNLYRRCAILEVVYEEVFETPHMDSDQRGYIPHWPISKNIYRYKMVCEGDIKGFFTT